MFWSYHWLKKNRERNKIEEIQRLRHKKSKVRGRKKGRAPEAPPHPLVPPNTVFE